MSFIDATEIMGSHACPQFDRLRSQGYSLEFRTERGELPSMTELFVKAVRGGLEFGTANFTDDPEGMAFYCQNVAVHKDHRHRGLGTAMYVFAEKLMDKKLYNFWAGDAHQTEAAKRLWAQPNRPFGN